MNWPTCTRESRKTAGRLFPSGSHVHFGLHEPRSLRPVVGAARRLRPFWRLSYVRRDPPQMSADDVRSRGESSFSRHVDGPRPRCRDKRLSPACGGQFLGRSLIGEGRDLLPIPLAERRSTLGLLRQPPAFGRGSYHLPLSSHTRCCEAMGQHHSARLHSGHTGVVTAQRGTYVA